MTSVFLDSSILVAAAASLSGASSLILGYCKKKRLIGYISADVIKEAQKNVTLKLDQKAQERFIEILSKSSLITIPTPPTELIVVCERVIYPKDAPILASAILSPVKYILSLDKKHFFTPKVKLFVKPKRILKPGDFVQQILVDK